MGFLKQAAVGLAVSLSFAAPLGSTATAQGTGGNYQPELVRNSSNTPAECARDSYERAVGIWGERPSKVSSYEEALNLTRQALKRNDYTEAKQRASQATVIYMEEDHSNPFQIYDLIDNVQLTSNSTLYDAGVPLAVQIKNGSCTYQQFN